MATVARLNQVASQTPSAIRKRLRTSDLQDATPRKRQALEDESQQQHLIEVKSTGQRSATRLRSRSSLPASTPAPRSQRKDVYQLQDSPKQDKEIEKPKEKSQEQKRGIKRRILNRKADKKSSGTEVFDRRRQSAFNPLKVKGVTLETVDSPAKNTRAKREQPHKKLDINYVKIVPLDAEAVREASPELGIVVREERLPASGQPNQWQDEVGSENGTEQTDQDDEPPGPSHDTVTGNEINDSASDNEMVIELETADGDAPAVRESNWQQTISSQDLNFIARQQEENARQKQQKIEEGKAKRQGETSEDRTSKSKRRETRPNPQPQIERKGTDVDEHFDPDEYEQEHDGFGASKAQAEQTKRKRRPKMSEEEKNARKEEAARIRQDNAHETEKSETEKFEARGEKFIEGIEDLAAQIGGLEFWSKLGAGAKTITEMVKKKSEMEEARAQNLWRKLNELKNIFSGKEVADEERINHVIRKLKANSTWAVLTRNDDVKAGDTTVIDLYEQLIPLSVYVLKEEVKERFVPTHDVSWRELQDITDIAIDLCDVASAWQPKPSNLEGGIRNHVRRHIRPGLASIQNNVKLKLKQLEVREEMKNRLAAFAKRQELKKEEKRRMWEQMNLECPDRQLPQPGGYVSSHRSSQGVTYEAEQVEEIYEVEHQQPIPNRGSHVRPKPSLRRQLTEEIPAPDPNTSWSERENVALLNGLQEYLNENRYVRILEDPKFARALREKDVDQCMARARFYKAGCSQILKEKAEAGDGSFDWLRTVRNDL